MEPAGIRRRRIRRRRGGSTASRCARALARFGCLAVRRRATGNRNRIVPIEYYSFIAIRRCGSPLCGTLLSILPAVSDRNDVCFPARIGAVGFKRRIVRNQSCEMCSLSEHRLPHGCAGLPSCRRIHVSASSWSTGPHSIAAQWCCRASHCLQTNAAGAAGDCIARPETV